ncbi:MAG TPA: YfhO family protein [Myxococcales bacterium]|nr:YfhO family protein [Myxococcales bacterium]
MRPAPTTRPFRALFALGPAVLLLRSLASGRALGQGDLALLSYPCWSYLGRSLRQGRLPLWDPELGAGIPFLASPQTQALYPPAALVSALLPLHVGAYVLLFAHLYWAGYGMERLARRLGLPSTSAICAGTLVACAPVLFASIPRPNLLCAASWLPWMLVAADRVCRRERFGIPALAACFGLPLLCGQPEVALIGAVGVAAIAALRRDRRPRPVPGTTGTPAGRGLYGSVAACALGGLLGVALVSISLFPFLELLHHSTRGEDLHGLELAWSMRWGDFAGLFLPFLRLDARWRDFDEIFFGPFQGYLSVVYLGAPALVLGGFACRRGGRREWACVAAVLGAVAVASWGGHLSLLLERFHAGFLAWRYSIKFIVPAAFAAALLAALGAEQLARSESRRLPLAFAAVGAGGVMAGMLATARLGTGLGLSIAWAGMGLLALAAVLRWVPGGPWKQWSLVAVCALDAVLCSFHVPFQSQDEGCESFFAGVRAQLGQGRLDALSGTPAAHSFGFMAPRTGTANVCIQGVKPTEFGLPMLGLYGMPAPAGVDSTLDRFGAAGDGLLGVTLVLRSVPTPLPGLVPLEAAQLAPLWAATVTGAAPRVELRPTARVSADVPGDLARETIEQLRAEVLLDAPPPPATPAGAPWAGPDQATLLSDAGEHVRVETASGGERWLVLADLDYPGWFATVDGVATPIRRAYGMVRAVRLGAGRHRVVFDYRPASFRAGALVSALAALALLAGSLVRRRRPPLS